MSIELDLLVQLLCIIGLVCAASLGRGAVSRGSQLPLLSTEKPQVAAADSWKRNLAKRSRGLFILSISTLAQEPLNVKALSMLL